MNHHHCIPCTQFLDFLAWVNESEHEASNAAADLHNAIAQHVLPEKIVRDAIFQDGPEADTLEVPGGTMTAMLANWLVTAIQLLRADLPDLVEKYTALSRARLRHDLQ